MDYNRTSKKELIRLLKEAQKENARLAVFQPDEHHKRELENLKLKNEFISDANQIIADKNEELRKENEEMNKEVARLRLTIVAQAKELML
jgi:hypothetical protein